jgi:hypothetical protein
VFGVEPICRVLTSHGHKIATSTYYAVKHRPPSARAVRDAELKGQISRIYTDNFSVYGVRILRGSMRLAKPQVSGPATSFEAVQGGKRRRLRYSQEQGLASRLLLPSDLFAPETLASYVI